MENVLILIFIFLIGFIITYILIYWYIVLLLSIINSNAQYDERSKKSILKLAQKDKVWRGVVKMLDLDKENK